jgi:hypothetical protein
VFAWIPEENKVSQSKYYTLTDTVVWHEVIVYETKLNNLIRPFQKISFSRLLLRKEASTLMNSNVYVLLCIFLQNNLETYIYNMSEEVCKFNTHDLFAAFKHHAALVADTNNVKFATEALPII